MASEYFKATFNNSNPNQESIQGASLSNIKYTDGLAYDYPSNTMSLNIADEVKKKLNLAISSDAVYKKLQEYLTKEDSDAIVTSLTDELNKKVDEVFLTSNYYTKTKIDEKLYDEANLVNQLVASKVDKVTGKGLSTFDFNGTYKSAIDLLPYEFSQKVDKEQGKMLTSNDFSNYYVKKLDDIEAGAQVNSIEHVLLNGVEVLAEDRTIALTVITSLVDDLVNYYKKSETYTKEEIQELLRQFTGSLAFEVVDTLPEENISTTTIYLVPRDESEENNVYIEYFYINGRFEIIGSTTVDLTNYVTKTNLETILTDYVTNQSLTQTLTAYVTSQTFQNKLNETLEDYVTNDDFNQYSAGITEAFTNVETNLDTKVDKVEGKGLSANDYDDTAKGIVDSTTENLSKKVSYSYLDKVGTKNLILLTRENGYEYSANGVTIVKNNDGTFHVSGTATDYFSIPISKNRLPVGSYTVSGCPEGGTYDTYYLYSMSSENPTGLNVFDYGEGGLLNVKDTETQTILRIVVKTGATVDLTFKPMIRLSSNTDSTYEPYSKTNQELTNDLSTLENSTEAVLATKVDVDDMTEALATKVDKTSVINEYDSTNSVSNVYSTGYINETLSNNNSDSVSLLSEYSAEPNSDDVYTAPFMNTVLTFLTPLPSFVNITLQNLDASLNNSGDPVTLNISNITQHDTSNITTASAAIKDAYIHNTGTVCYKTKISVETNVNNLLLASSYISAATNIENLLSTIEYTNNTPVILTMENITYSFIIFIKNQITGKTTYTTITNQDIDHKTPEIKRIEFVNGIKPIETKDGLFYAAGYLEIEVTDNFAIGTKPYKFGSRTNEWTSDNRYLINRNGIYYVAARDLCGNITENYNTRINFINSVCDVYNVSYKRTYNASNNTVSVAMTIVYGNYEISSGLPFSLDKNTWSNTSFTFSENGEQTIYARDGWYDKETTTPAHVFEKKIYINEILDSSKQHEFGVEVDFANSAFTRLGDAVGMTSEDFDNVSPWNRKRCTLSKDGGVLSYIGESTYYETTDNVMVEQPIFWVKAENVSDSVKRYWISDYPKSGYIVCPGFHNNSGNLVRNIYLSAYEASLYDTSESKYILDDAQVADFDNDLLVSRINAKPVSGSSQNLTRANMRKLANNIGSGWQLPTIFTLGITQLLFLIEYASFNSQQIIGRGVVDTSASILTGSTSSLGNKTGMAEGVNGKVAISYRGEENIYGNIWHWIDGINCNGSSTYVKEYGTMTDDIATGYTQVGFNRTTSNGYISNYGVVESHPNLFLPIATSGTENGPVGDYYYYNSGWRVVRSGGPWNSGSGAGLFYLTCYSASSDRGGTVGGRLLYVPQ